MEFWPTITSYHLWLAPASSWCSTFDYNGDNYARFDNLGAQDTGLVNTTSSRNGADRMHSLNMTNTHITNMTASHNGHDGLYLNIMRNTHITSKWKNFANYEEDIGIA